MAEATNNNNNNNNQNPPAQAKDESLRTWVMVGLTAVFVVLYVAALVGWIAPLPDNAVVLRLEPIVAVIIGYYFGRVPGEKNERTLKEGIKREENKAREAEQKKEQAQQQKAEAERTTEALVQKVRDTRAALSAGEPQADEAFSATRGGGGTGAAVGGEAARQTVAAALRVLDA